MSCGREDIPMRSSIFLATNFVRGSRSIAKEKSSPISVPQSRPKRPSRCGRPIRNWRLRQCSHQSLEDLSRLYNPIIRGWIQYYGRYYRTALYSVIRQLDDELVKWARQKYKKLRNRVQRARCWVRTVSRRAPHSVRALGQNARWFLDGSRMTRECHVRFCERLGVKLPGATLLLPDRENAQ